MCVLFWVCINGRPRNLASSTRDVVDLKLVMGFLLAPEVHFSFCSLKNHFKLSSWLVRGEHVGNIRLR